MKKSLLFFKIAQNITVLYLLIGIGGPIKLLAQNIPPAQFTGTTINYTRTWQMTAPGVNPASLSTAPVSDVKQTTQYFDALERPIQIVTKQSSPQGYDGVATHTYDPTTGTETFKYLPFASTAVQAGDITNDGKFKSDAFQQQVAFYNTMWQGQPGETNIGANLNWAYQQDDYEASPLARVLSSFEPGANWVGSQSSVHGTKLLSLVNTAIDNVQMWNIGVMQGNLPSSSGTYSAGTLYKIISTDEQGRQSILYKDLYGQVILKKVQNTAPADDGSGSAHNGWLCTYYVYDDYGNQRFIITPDAVLQIDGSWSISQTTADELCFRFEYDLLNRMAIKRAPGTATGSQGEVWMVYDVRNRLVMMQDGVMRPSSQWLCYIYDALDRKVITGTTTYVGTLSQLQSTVTLQTSSNSSGTVSGSAPTSVQQSFSLSNNTYSGDYQASVQITLGENFTSGTQFSASIVQSQLSSFVVVNNNPLPAGVTLTPLSATFYDNYDWLAISGVSLSPTLIQTYTQNSAYFNTNYNASPTYAQPIVQGSQIQGLATGEMTAVIGSSAPPLYGLNIYDDRGRTIQVQKVNLSGGLNITTNQYSWSGLLLQSLSQEVLNGGSSHFQLVSTINRYDAMERPLAVTKTLQSTTNGTTLPAASSVVVINSYDELSRLKQELLGNNTESRLYEYNPRGWLLGVNRNFAKTNSQNNNYFGYDLAYDNPTIADANSSVIGNFSSQTFNGNIAGSVWKTKGDNQIRKYDYGYDGTSRLITADFNQYSQGSFNKSAGLDFSMSNLTYDANGNIGTMNRNGWVLGGSQPIDQLNYSYINGNGTSNRLQNVIDNSAHNSSTTPSTLGDFHYSGAKTSGNADYTYDANGNVTSDYNRGISSISYNYMDLPSVITFSNSKGTISYIYDAAGNKLQKITTENNGSIPLNGNTYTSSVTTKTTYDQGVEYKTVSYSNPSLAALQCTDKLQFLSVQTGRIRALYTNPADQNQLVGFAFDYFLKDNLGNVRMVLTDQQETDIYPAATIETSSIATEQQYYNITNDGGHVIATISLPWWNNASGTTYQDNNGLTNPGNSNPGAASAQVYRLNGQTGDKFGLGVTLKVMAGDQISIFAKSIWHNTGTTPGSYPINDALNNFINSFAGTSAVVSGGHGIITGSTLNGASATTTGLQSFIGSTQNPADPSTTPKAAVNWILFNDQFVPVAMGTDLVSSSGDVMKSHSLLNIPMVANGYLYVYCSDESSTDVFFDNLQVVNKRGPILEETHYYPYGLAMAGISDRAWNQLPDYLHYNGNELQTQEFTDGTGLDEYDFNARYYDQQLGRFLQQDPENLSGGQESQSPYQFGWNNPVLRSDPSGKCPICVIAIVGAVVNVAMHWSSISTVNGFNWAALGEAAVIGAGTSVLGAFTGGASYAALGLEGFLGGAVSGVFSSAFSGLTGSILNGVVFGDPFSLSNFSRDVFVGGATSGILNGVSAASSGGNFWDGSVNVTIPPPSTIDVPLQLIPEPEINTSNATEGLGTTIESPINQPITGVEIDQPLPQIKNEGYKFSTKQISHLSDENLQWMRQSGRSQFNTTPPPRDIMPGKIEVSIQRVWNDLNNGNYTVVRMVKDGKMVVKFDYEIGTVFVNGVNKGPSEFATLVINSKGLIHLWPTIGGQ
jgi:RHS repeat-associated protein